MKNIQPSENVNWVNKLVAINSLDEIKRALLEKWPAFNVKNLTEIIILGFADEGKRALEQLLKNGVTVRGIYDDSPEVVGQQLLGFYVKPTSEMKKNNIDCPVIIASHRTLKASLYCKNLGFSHVAPLALLQVLYPLQYPPHMFYDGLLEDLLENKKEYLQLTNAFEDEISKEVYNSVIAYRVTLDPTVLTVNINWKLYDTSDIFQLSDNEIYIDAGTFDGDSVNIFIDKVNNKYSRIVAFEPDVKNFNRLVVNMATHQNVECINKGLYHQNEVLQYHSSGTRTSTHTDAKGGGDEMTVTSLDEFLSGEPCTLIKMNIEGAENSALRGSINTLRKYKPKLLISLYHKPKDLWQLPALIKSLNSDYKFYLRQYDGGIIETVLIAV